MIELDVHLNKKQELGAQWQFLALSAAVAKAAGDGDPNQPLYKVCGWVNAK